MSALWRSSESEAVRLRPMTVEHLDAVMAVELASHLRPWTRGNFADSLASGYCADALFDTRASLIGYCIAAPGADEMHLLNLSVAPAQRQRGHARYMLDALVERCRANRLTQLWLEVRVSNENARRLYRGYGMREVGLRPAYYPAAPNAGNRRGEDAVLMQLQIEGTA
ncbi:MAG: ribosomal protein S18-alanine N-acetyltransferase [Rhizobacter sp.]|nr:ribosomal protein S18-alanine N-acetyltransferase [Rhizobacter sp.]